MADRLRRTTTPATEVEGPNVIIASRGDRAIGTDDYLFSKRMLTLFTQVNEDSARRLVEAIFTLADIDPKAEITLYIDSPGGLVTAGLAIMEAMDAVPCDIRTVCVGQAASMAAIILSHGTQGKRLVGPQSRVLIHQPSAGASGKSTDMEISTEETARLRRQSVAILAANSGQLPADVEADFKDDLWLNAEQAIEYGLADKLLPAKRLRGTPDAVNPPSKRAAEILAERATRRGLASGSAQPPARRQPRAGRVTPDRARPVVARRGPVQAKPVSVPEPPAVA
jgi:ATP-dependent Clp protease protease subunit